MIKYVFGEVPDREPEKTDWGILQDSMKPIIPFYQDEEVSDILINRYDQIFIIKNGKYELTDATFKSESFIERFAKQMANCLRQSLDGVLDARFPDCSRACFTTKDVTPSGITASLRLNRSNAYTMNDLVNNGALNQEMSDFLINHVHMRSNMMIVGGTGSGKTTLLRALSMHVPTNERILIAEDTQELNLSWFKNKIAMEAPHRAESRINLPMLIKTMLRQNGDRAWVGEIRDAHAADAYLQCIDTGTRGVYSTMHAPSLNRAVSKLQYLLSSQGFTSYEVAKNKVLESIQIFVQCIRTNQFGRKFTEIAYSNGKELITIYQFNMQTCEYEKVNEFDCIEKIV